MKPNTEALGFMLQPDLLLFPKELLLATILLREFAQPIA